MTEDSLRAKPVFTLVVDGVPHRYSSEAAPSIGAVVTVGEREIRVIRSADGGRVFVGEVMPASG